MFPVEREIDGRQIDPLSVIFVTNHVDRGVLKVVIVRTEDLGDAVFREITGQCPEQGGALLLEGVLVDTEACASVATKLLGYSRQVWSVN